MPRKKQNVRPDGLFEVKVTVGYDISGKRIQKSFYGKSKLEARRKAQEYITEQEAAKQTGQVVIKKNYTFEEWAVKWLEVYKKPNTTANGYRMTYENTVKNHLVPYFGKASLLDIRSADIQAFFSQKADFSESMLDKMRLCLNGIFETAIENDLCYKNPAKQASFKSSKVKHEKQVYTSEQADLVKAKATGTMNEVVILLETGLRRGELLALQWGDVDFEQGVLEVKRSIRDIQGERVEIGPPKMDSYRTIPLPPQSLKLLQTMPKNGKYIFLNEKGEPHSPNSWSRRLSRFMAAVHRECPNIPVLSAHELRHTYGTLLRRKGIDIYTIQKVMGHKDIKMTSEIYVHNEVDVLKEEVLKAF